MINLSDTSVSQSVLLIGAHSHDALAEEADRIATYLEHAPGVSLRDIAYTSALAAKQAPHRLGLVVASGDTLSLHDRLRTAARKIRSGIARIRDKAGTYYFREPPIGKVAFLYAGATAWHPEMLREAAFCSPIIRQRLEEAEEALSALFGEGTATDLLYPFRPSSPDNAPPALTAAVTIADVHAANLAYTDMMARLGLVPDAVAGIGCGAYSAAAVAGATIDQQLRIKRVRAIRESARLMSRLATRKDMPSVAVLSVERLARQKVEEIAAGYPGRCVVSQAIAPDYHLICVAPDIATQVSSDMQTQGGVVTARHLALPFNTPWAAKALPLLNQFCSAWLRDIPRIPIYSTTENRKIEAGQRVNPAWVADQFLNPVDFAGTVERLYEDGVRVFVDAGVRGLLARQVSAVLGAERPHLSVSLNRFHRPDRLQLCHAIAQLGALPLPLDLSGADEFTGAVRLDFDTPVPREVSPPIRLDSVLPRVDPDVLLNPLKGGVNLNPVRTALPEAESPASIAPEHAEQGGCTCGVRQPLLQQARVLSLEPGISVELHATIKLVDYPFLRDYALGSSRLSRINTQLRGMTLLSVPTGIELMCEAAQRLLPDGLRVVRILGMKAQRWLGFERDLLDVRLWAERVSWGIDGQYAVKVQLRKEQPNSGFTWPALEATVVFSAAYPPTRRACPNPLVNPRAVNWSGRDIYPRRLFQGPQLRTIRHVDSWSENGIDYELEAPSPAQAITSVELPAFAVAPILFDGVVSGFPLWRSHEKFEGAISFPFRARSICFFAPEPPPGGRLKAYLRLTGVTPRSLTVDISVSDGQGNQLVEIHGWEELSTHVARKLYDFTLSPTENYFTDPLPNELMPPAPVPVWGAVVQSFEPRFFTGNQELWLKTLAMIVLTPQERDEWYDNSSSVARRLEWMLGRVAAKEAVRRHLQETRRERWGAADIAVWPDDSGKPHAIGPWMQEQGGQLDLSIAHTASLVVAAVAENARLGIDLERLGRDLSEEFARGVFSQEEQNLAASCGDAPAMLLRFCCAKEAVSKALGTGIRYSPIDLRVRSADCVKGMVEMELLGGWLDPFPRLKGQRIAVRVSTYANHAVAACILPAEQIGGTP